MRRSRRQRRFEDVHPQPEFARDTARDRRRPIVAIVTVHNDLEGGAGKGLARRAPLRGERAERPRDERAFVARRNDDRELALTPQLGVDGSSNGHLQGHPDLVPPIDRAPIRSQRFPSAGQDA